VKANGDGRAARRGSETWHADDSHPSPEKGSNAYGPGMKISDVLRTKGSAVITVAPHETVTSLLSLLAQHNIGAVVVSSDGVAVDGIVSERDVVRQLHARGTELLDAPVSSIMTASVLSCTPDDDLNQIGALMTENRIRHLPVVVDGRLAAIVSIGDVVKARIDQLASERDLYEAYISQ
jgi:CBS domain-containing protein